MIRFVQRATGEIFRVLQQSEQGLCLISFNEPATPLFVPAADSLERIETPASFLEAQQRTLTPAVQRKLALIQPLLDDGECIIDRGHRLSMVKEIATNSTTTTKRILRIYYRYLARGELGSHPERETKKRPDYDWAIQKFYFSAKRLSLRATYDMMLVQKYTDTNGQLLKNAPSWNSFQRYFYNNNYHKKPEKIIAREGLTYYQRNCRPAFGATLNWRPQPGAYQMDATEADIYLLSRFDWSTVIGRPYIYMAVDTATQIIAGIYIGLEAGELAVLKTLENAACDKVAFCRQYGIEIAPGQWPSSGLPAEIITDKGRDFCSGRVQEFSARYGIEMQSLPPFRPDQKSAVEKSFDLLQTRYKPMLRGKGVVEDNAQERWAKDYRAQAILNLDEFTAIVVQCVLYLNAGRILHSGKTPAQAWTEADTSLLAVDMDELHKSILPRTRAKLTRKGIAYNGMTYIPDASAALHIGSSYEIACDPLDSSTIFICEDNVPIGNPFLAAMPEMMGRDEFLLEIQNKPKLPHGLPSMTPAERRQAISTLSSIFIPLDFMYAIFDRVYRAISSTYCDRSLQNCVCQTNAHFVEVRLPHCCHRRPPEVSWVYLALEKPPRSSVASL